MSLTSNTISIEDKKREKLLGNSKEKENNWKDFSIFVFIGLFTTLGIGIFGSNFIFLTSNDNLEYFLPTEKTSYFKPDQLGGGIECSRNSIKFKGFNLGNWPYSMRKSGFLPGFFQGFKNWIADTTANTFIINRRIIKSFLTFFTPGKNNDNIFSNNVLQMFFIAPMTLGFAPLSYIITLFTSFISAFESNALWSITGFFLLFLWPITLTISFVQFIQYILLFTFQTLFTNPENIKGIIHCNAHMLSLFFGGFVCLGALLNLNRTIAVISTVIYLIMVIMSLFNK